MTTSRIARWALALLVLSMLGAMPGAAHAQAAEATAEAGPTEAGPTEAQRLEASAHFRRGVTLYEEGDYEAAMIEFQRAYDVLPTYNVLFNIGQTQLAMWHYVAALRAFEAYLEQGGERIDAERRAQVEEAIATLRGRTGTIALRVNVDGAEIRVDEEEVGRAPLAEPLPVDVGRHVIEVRAPEHQPWRETITIAGGEAAELDVTLHEIAATVVVEQRSESHPVRTVGITGLVITGAVAIGAVVTGVLAVQSHDRLQEQLGVVPGDRAAIEGARDETATLSLATDVMIASAVVLGGVSLALVIADSGGDESEQAPSASLHVTPTGVAVRGTF
ncbi:PEGA domain-containing protein [Sandaracinus amylolyticus]|uniref:PEGA domain-containing protein n=1 Tax=Sandaracinus amylolyticus TaxID=927083 RepID=UPI001F39354D|nr:PEGA domain-containing protein [Sandaracinus amylolyticus]UJR86646.1 Hypothetical protein I5071_87470 [Sandaracinus amylolyticus]